MAGSLPLSLSPRYPSRGSSGRRWLALALRSASRMLARVSRALSAADRVGARAPSPPVIEFYAQAGAPEGALYVNGRLVGYLSDVSRL